MKFDCRSALYMPASNARALEKGPSLAADAIIVDLEDSVSPGSKAVARNQAVQTLQQADYGYRLRALRINAADTSWYVDDMAAAAQCSPDVIVLPKVECVDDVARASAAMDMQPSLEHTAIWAMMETPLAVLNAQQIAACVVKYPRLTTFLIGNNDMARAAGMPVQSDRKLLIPWLMGLVASAKAYQLHILDGVYNDYSDADGFAAECAQGVCMGMNGKTLIHPSQLVATNAAYSPSMTELEKARAVVGAFALPENSEKGAISINGRMTERLHLDIAEQLLKRADLLSTRR